MTAEFPVLQQPYGQKHTHQSIPWEIAAIAYQEYARQFGTRQSIERIAERGGFATSELDMLYPGWREHLARLMSGG